MRFLAFTRKLALLTPALTGCGSAPPPPPPATVSPPAPTTTAETTSEPITTGGPCRCSWDNNAAAASRVCKKGESNYEGQACVAATHPKYNGPVKGPLPPPDLPTQEWAAS